MPLDISKAPAKFDNWKNSASAPRAVPEGHGAPVVHSEKELDITLDLSADHYAKLVDWLAPGTTLMAKEMAGVGQDVSQTITVKRRKMPEIAVTMHDAQGRHVLLKLDRAKLAGATRLKISAQGGRIQWPVRIKGCVPRDRLTQLDEYLFHDLIVTVVANQMDVEEESARAHAGKKRKKNTTTLVIERESGDDEQLSLT